MSNRSASLSRALLAAVPLLCAGCDDGGATQAGAPRSEVFAGVRDLMYRVEAARLQIEPSLRNPTKLEELQESGRQIAALIEEPDLAAYPDDPAFHLDAALFREYHEQFRSATADFNEAVEAGDMEAWNDAYEAVYQTCTRCHKRFDPNP